MLLLLLCRRFRDDSTSHHRCEPADRQRQLATRGLRSWWAVERQRSLGLIAETVPNMLLRPNTFTRRYTACVMLAVWLFALASGLVNACVLEPHGAQEHSSSPLRMAHEDTLLVVSGHHAESYTSDAGAADIKSTKASCLKACDEGSQSLLKHPASVDLVDPGLALFVTASWNVQVHRAPAPGQAHDFRLPERGPPVRVLFSRLAL